MHEVLVNRIGGLRKSVVRLTDRPDMTLDVYRGRKTTNQQINNNNDIVLLCTVPMTGRAARSYGTPFYLLHMRIARCCTE